VTAECKDLLKSRLQEMERFQVRIIGYSDGIAAAKERLLRSESNAKELIQFTFEEMHKLLIEQQS
jgi:hypothetical protein